MRILITRTDRIGDVMLSTPVIKAVRDKYPHAYIACCVQKETREIVDNNPYLDEVIVYDKKGEYKNIFGIIRFIVLIKKRKFDLALILHPTNRMNLTCFFAGIPRRVGYDRKFGMLLTDKIPHTKQLGAKHEVEYTLDVVRRIGIDSADKRLYMSLHADAEKNVQELFSKYKIDKTKKILAIHPSASCLSKRWPAERFAEVIDRLNQKHHVSIILLGGDFDKVCSERVRKHVNSEVFDLTGKTSISTLAGILAKSAIFISNDSGPVHIAVSLGTPVIVLFGRNDPGISPERWGPRGDRDVVFHKDVGCDVCLAHRCQKGFKCLSAITADEVIAAAERLLNSV